MSCFPWCTNNIKIKTLANITIDSDNDVQEQESILITDSNEEETINNIEIKYIYFTLTIPNQYLIDILTKSFKNFQIFNDEIQFIEYIKLIKDKIFLIINDEQSTILIDSIQSFKQIDSIFFYCLSPNAITTIRNKQHTYIIHFCQNIYILNKTIQMSRMELIKQIEILSKYNTKEKQIYNLSKEQGSYLLFQLVKNIFKNMPKNVRNQTMMIETCKNYYRTNSIELTNIEDFQRTYELYDVIFWFTKDIFLKTLINKTLRVQKFDLYYIFHFYIMDLNEQIQLKFKQLKEKQQNIFKLYCAVELTHDEVIDYQNSIGNIISNIEYLLATSEYSIAYDCLRKLEKQENITHAIIEYLVDLNLVQNTTIADIQQCSAFPDKYQFLIDTGGLFQIDSCEYNAVEDIWYIKVHATDQIDDMLVDYIEYKEKIAVESNTLLYFGNLFIDMGDYTAAERYFDTILNCRNPNDEEIACIFYNLGRIHRLKGDFSRSINCYNRSLNLHINARPKRRTSAGKTLNGLGNVFMEQGRELHAEQCFRRAMRYYKKSIPKMHVDVAGTLTNLGTIDYNRGNFKDALKKYRKASKIYDRCLPLLHPNRVLPKINCGNIHFVNKNYQNALEEYEAALKLQQASLPTNHSDMAQTLHNIALAHFYQKNIDEAKKYIQHAEEISKEKLPITHPVIKLIEQTKNFINEE